MNKEEAIRKGFELLEESAKTASKVGADLIVEYLNYLVFIHILEVIFSLSVFISFALLLRKGLKYVNEQFKKLPLMEKEEAAWFKNNPNSYYDKERVATVKKDLIFYRYLLVLTSIICCLFFGRTALNDIKDLGHILIAPKIYLLKEGVKLVKRSSTEFRQK